jgi:hypothetical protein
LKCVGLNIPQNSKRE